MHIQATRNQAANPHVEVTEPWSAGGGRTVGPELQVWPLGQGELDHYWSFDLDEAVAVARALLDGVERARELFPG